MIFFFLSPPRASGLKYEKAKEWRIPCVNAQWLCDILLGNFEALRQIQHSRYTVFNLQDPLSPSQHLVLNLLGKAHKPFMCLFHQQGGVSSGGNNLAVVSFLFCSLFPRCLESPIKGVTRTSNGMLDYSIYTAVLIRSLLACAEASGCTFCLCSVLF